MTELDLKSGCSQVQKFESNSKEKSTFEQKDNIINFSYVVLKYGIQSDPENWPKAKPVKDARKLQNKLLLPKKT